jgi:hypothetical protein
MQMKESIDNYSSKDNKAKNLPIHSSASQMQQGQCYLFTI